MIKNSKADVANRAVVANAIGVLNKFGVFPYDPGLVDPVIQNTLHNWSIGDHPHAPGGFMQAILKGNFVEATVRADTYNLFTIGAIRSWLQQFMPLQAWGSEEKYESWLEMMITRHREPGAEEEPIQAPAESATPPS